jgi:transcription elongation GreA/GreB family factor
MNRLEALNLLRDRTLALIDSLRKIRSVADHASNALNRVPGDENAFVSSMLAVNMTLSRRPKLVKKNFDEDEQEARLLVDRASNALFKAQRILELKLDAIDEELRK